MDLAHLIQPPIPKLQIRIKIFFCNRHYSLLSFGRPQRYNSEALPFTYMLPVCRFLVPGNTQKNLTEIWHHFWLKMMIKSCQEKNILKFHGGLQRYLLTCQANSAFLGRFLCSRQQQLWRGSLNFKIKNSRPLFTIIFK